MTWSHAAPAARRAGPAARTAWSVRARRSCGDAGHPVDAEQGRAAAEDVLDDDHALRAAEPAERRLGGLVGLGDPAVHPDVGDPVGIVDVAQGPGEHGFGEVEAPAAVGGQRGAQRRSGRRRRTRPPTGVERVPLAGHRHVLVRFSRSRTGRPVSTAPSAATAARPVRLHLLAAEAAAHAQALDGDVVAVPAEDVRDDLLGLRRVLGGGLDEDLAVLVDQRERGVGLEVEVLLPAELELAAEPCGAWRSRRRRRPGTVRRGALEALRRDRLLDGDERGQRLGLDLDGRRRPAGPPQGSPRAPRRPAWP